MQFGLQTYGSYEDLFSALKWAEGPLLGRLSLISLAFSFRIAFGRIKQQRGREGR
jgi:hypothetical protein